MRETFTGGRPSGVIGHENGNAAALAVANWLCLAATPTFALMALLTSAPGGGVMTCTISPAASPPGGMTVMYLLMSVFHSAPWLKLIRHRRRG